MSALWGFDVDTDPALVTDAATQSTIAATQSTTASAQATIAAAKRWQSRLFTTSGTWTVPADVGLILVDGSSPGGGGGGGDPTPGGGGGGGGPGENCRYFPIAVIPNETLTVVITTPGVGGSPGSNGTSPGGPVTISTSAGVIFRLLVDPSQFGSKGLNPNGGASGAVAGTVGTGVIAGGAGDGANNFSTVYGSGSSSTQAWGSLSCYMSGRLYPAGVGGALNFNSGLVNNTIGGASGIATGNASGGGGGAGGSTQFGVGGAGGSNGAAGSNATGYGAGGGGGSGNAKGGDGSPGFVRIYCFSATTI